MRGRIRRSQGRGDNLSPRHLQQTKTNQNIQSIHNPPQFYAKKRTKNGRDKSRPCVMSLRVKNPTQPPKINVPTEILSALFAQLCQIRGGRRLAVLPLKQPPAPIQSSRRARLCKLLLAALPLRAFVGRLWG